MNPKPTLQHVFITDCALTNPLFWQLYLIFRDTLYPAMPFKAFRAYYRAAGLTYIDATFIRCNGAVVGFCAAAFYRTATGKKSFTLARAAIGIMAHSRGHKLPKWTLYFKYIRYKLHHPFAPLVLTGYIANPLIYAMICKYTGIVYPKPDAATPPAIQRLRQTILRTSRLQAGEEPEFVVKIHFQVAMGRDILARIFQSDDVYVRHFLAVNPRFQEQFGMMVIIPVSWENILRSAHKFVANFCRREKERWNRLFAPWRKEVPAP